jgi:hypothetical protein
MPNTPMIRSANANCSLGFIFLALLLVVSVLTPLSKAKGYGQTQRGEFVNRSVAAWPCPSMQFCVSQGARGGGGLQAALTGLAFNVRCRLTFGTEVKC